MVYRGRIGLDLCGSWKEECWTKSVEIVAMMVLVAIAGVNCWGPGDRVRGGEVRRELLETIFCTYHVDGSINCWEEKRVTGMSSSMFIGKTEASRVEAELGRPGAE